MEEGEETLERFDFTVFYTLIYKQICTCCHVLTRFHSLVSLVER